MHFQHATDAFTLKNGVKIPCIGFGTWQSADGPTAENAVREAATVILTPPRSTATSAASAAGSRIPASSVKTFS